MADLRLCSRQLGAGLLDIEARHHTLLIAGFSHLCGLASGFSGLFSGLLLAAKAQDIKILTRYFQAESLLPPLLGSEAGVYLQGGRRALLQGISVE
jgi:hypothetical protein